MITSEWPTAELPNTAPFIVQQVKFLRRAGVDVDVFHFRGAKKPLNYIRAWSKLHHKISKNCYSLAHAQFGQSGLLALPKKIPLVVSFRGDDLLGVVWPRSVAFVAAAAPLRRAVHRRETRQPTKFSWPAARRRSKGVPGLATRKGTVVPGCAETRSRTC